MSSLIKPELLSFLILNISHANKNLTLNTASLNDTSNSHSISAGITVGGDLANNTASNVSGNFSNDNTDSKIKNLATIGLGTINITNKENSDTKLLNRDIENNELDIYAVESHQGLDVELDTNMLSEDGRNAIVEDIVRTEKMGEAIIDVVTEESVGIQHVFEHIDNVNKNIDVHKAMASQDPDALKTMNDPNATPEQKQEALTIYANAYAEVYGIKIEDAMVIASNREVTDEFGKTGVAGGAHEERTNAEGKTSTIFINDEESDNILETAGTMTHEVTHAQISQDGISDRGSNQLNEDYSKLMQDYGSDSMEFTFSQNTNTLGTINMSGNNHVGNTQVGPTVMNTNTAKFNEGVDAGKLDYKVIEHVTLYGEDDGEFVTLKKHVDYTYETTLPEAFSNALEYPEFREAVKTELLNAGSVAISAAGVIATGGTANVLYGVGVAMDIYSTTQNNDLTYGMGILLVPDTGKVGAVAGTINAINNSYIRDDND